jgi:hypothetical protein
LFRRIDEGITVEVANYPLAASLARRARSKADLRTREGGVHVYALLPFPEGRQAASECLELIAGRGAFVDFLLMTQAKHWHWASPRLRRSA